MRVSLPLIFPGLLIISTLQIMGAVSGRKDGVAAGALFSTVILPFLFAGYYLSRNREEIKWVRDVLPVLGFYPFVYSVKSPFSWILAGLIILIPALSTRYHRYRDNQTTSVIFVLSLLACLGIPSRSLTVIGLVLLSLVYYIFRRRLELQYLTSYIILWTFLDYAYHVGYFIFGLGVLFGFIVFGTVHNATRRIYI